MIDPDEDGVLTGTQVSREPAISCASARVVLAADDELFERV
jgi:hypothetical protein